MEVDMEAWVTRRTVAKELVVSRDTARATSSMASVAKDSSRATLSSSTDILREAMAEPTQDCRASQVSSRMHSRRSDSPMDPTLDLKLVGTPLHLVELLSSTKRKGRKPFLRANAKNHRSGLLFVSKEPPSDHPS